MLPVSIVLAMVFRNVRPKPTEQKLIKDLIVFDEEGQYGELVEEYQGRRYSNCVTSDSVCHDGRYSTLL